MDDLVVEPFAKMLPWAGWTYPHGQKRHVFGSHIVLLFWCNRTRRTPVSFRLRRAKREGLPAYRTKLELSRTLIATVSQAGLLFEYLTSDCDNARWFTKRPNAQKITWVSTLMANARVTYRGRTQQVAALARQLPRLRIAGNTRARARTMYLPEYGNVRLVVATNCRGV